MLGAGLRAGLARLQKFAVVRQGFFSKFAIGKEFEAFVVGLERGAARKTLIVMFKLFLLGQLIYCTGTVLV